MASVNSNRNSNYPTLLEGEKKGSNGESNGEAVAGPFEPANSDVINEENDPLIKTTTGRNSGSNTNSGSTGSDEENSAEENNSDSSPRADGNDNAEKGATEEKSEESTEEKSEAVTQTQLTINLILCGLGTGILSLPYNVANSGMLNAFVLTALVLLLNMVTNQLLVHACEKYQVFDIELLLQKVAEAGWGHRLPGSNSGGASGDNTGRSSGQESFFNAKRMWQWTALFAIWVTFFIVLVCYTTTFADSMSKLIQTFHGDPTVNPNHKDPIAHWLLCAIYSAVVFPLCFLHQSTLSWTSLISIIINVFVVLVIIYNFFHILGGKVSTFGDFYNSLPPRMDPDQSKEEYAKILATFERNREYAKEHLDEKDVCLFSNFFTNAGTLGCICAVLQACVIQPLIPEMYGELENSRKNPRSPAVFRKASLISTVVLYGLLMIFAVFGYLGYGTRTEGNIIRNLPTYSPDSEVNGVKVGMQMGKQWHSVITRMGMCFVMCTTYPLMIIPMTAPIAREFGMQWRIIATTIIVAIVFGISVFKPNLDMVNNLSGAFSVFFLVGLFPGMIGWKLLDYNAGWMGVLIWGGFVASVVGLLYEILRWGDVVRLMQGRCAWSM